MRLPVSLAFFLLLPMACSTPPASPPALETEQPHHDPAGAEANDEDGDAPSGFRALLLQMGVDYDPDRGSLLVSGWVNMTEGLVEVLACGPDGKTHEAVLVVDCIPSAVHAGLLALGMEPGTPVEHGTESDYRAPTGAPVTIHVEWTTPEGTQRIRVEKLILDHSSGKPLEDIAWIFTGSFMQSLGEDDGGTYAANYVKSLITTYHDPSTVLENPLPAGSDDTLFYANPETVPPQGTPIRLEIHPD